MNRPTVIARFTGNHQVSIPKPVREAIGLKLGDFLEITTKHGEIILRPKQLTDKPIPEVVATARERRALARVIAADARGETITLDEYHSHRVQRLASRSQLRRRKAAR